jgi:hypothetical protein
MRSIFLLLFGLVMTLFACKSEHGQSVDNLSLQSRLDQDVTVQNFRESVFTETRLIGTFSPAELEAIGQRLKSCGHKELAPAESYKTCLSGVPKGDTYATIMGMIGERREMKKQICEKFPDLLLLSKEEMYKLLLPVNVAQAETIIAERFKK